MGPIIGRASDGDSRRRQLILEDYKCKEGTRFGVDWLGWLLTVRLTEGNSVSGLYDQDYIHNGKKLVNPLDSVARTLMLGGDLCSINHVAMVYNTFSYEQHGLLQADVDRQDRQNWASAQRLCQQKTQACLASMRLSEDGRSERTLGIEMYFADMLGVH